MGDSHEPSELDPVKDQAAGEKQEPDRDIVYRYSREHRLQRASRMVRELNDETVTKPSIMRNLFGNKGNYAILMSIIVIVLMYFITTIFSGSSNSELKLGGNNITITIYNESNVLFLFVRKDVPSGVYAYTGAVDIAVSLVVTEGKDTPPIQTHRIFFSLETPETYLVSLPFDGEKFIVMLHTDNETITKTLTVSADQIPVH